MYNKDHDAPQCQGTFHQVVVACAFIKIDDQNIQVHYLDTRPLYDFLGYATLLLNNIVRGLSNNLSAVRVIIASYHECTIGVVSPDKIAKLEYPKIRYEKYVKQFFNPYTGFSETIYFHYITEAVKKERNSRFYTNTNVLHHDYYYIDGHTLGIKYSRRELKPFQSNFSLHNRNQISHICYSREDPKSNEGNMHIPKTYTTLPYYQLVKIKNIFKQEVLNFS